MRRADGPQSRALNYLLGLFICELFMCVLFFFVFIACIFGLRSHLLWADFAAFSQDAIVRYLQLHPLAPDDMQYLLLPVTCVLVEPFDMAEGLLVDV
jgi:hypothetical protein